MNFEFAGQPIEIKGAKRLPRAVLEKNKRELEKKIEAVRDKVRGEEKREVMSILSAVWDGKMRGLPEENPDYDRRVDQAAHPDSDAHYRGLYG